jgi:hypothetical protein
MEVRHWQEFCFSSLDPIFAFVALTLGTMSVPARIVTNANVATLIACIDMTSQLGCSALFYGVKRAQLPRIEPVTFYFGPYFSQHIGYFISTSLSAGYLPLHCAKSVSSGLKMR